MRAGAGQTPLSEFIRHGASGSSGTVTEPYALQQKFPFPFIHVHYAAGSSLAEAYYQSVSGPYQLLIVGDPLCQPWARPPSFHIEGLSNGQSLTESKEVSVGLPEEPAEAISKIHWFLDGQLRQTGKTDEPFKLNYTSLDAGFHELRAVAVADSPVASQARQLIEFQKEAPDVPTLEVVVPQKPVPINDEIAVSLKAAGATKIELFCNHRLLGTIDDSNGSVTVSAASLGLGKIRLTAKATFENEVVRVGEPASVTIVPSEGLKPASDGEGQKQLVLHWDDETESMVGSTESANWLAELKKNAGTKFVASTTLLAADDATYQLQVKGSMAIQLEVGKRVSMAEAGKWTYIPLRLLAGEHPLTIRGELDATPTLDIRFGERGTRKLPWQP